MERESERAMGKKETKNDNMTEMLVTRDQHGTGNVTLLVLESESHGKKIRPEGEMYV